MWRVSAGGRCYLDSDIVSHLATTTMSPAADSQGSQVTAVAAEGGSGEVKGCVVGAWEWSVGGEESYQIEVLRADEDENRPL